jgi:prolyl-tRNA synthetase
MRTFSDLGLLAIPLAADTGEIGGSLSHEFHVIADTGESTLYYDKKFDLLKEELADDLSLVKSLYAATEEKHNPKNCPIDEKELSVRKGIEVGHIFNFGDKYSKPMNAFVNNEKGKLVPIQMGSYGIGVSRLVAAIIEVSNDERGIIWPVSVAPFKISIINLNINDQNCNDVSYSVYNRLKAQNIEVLLDDTEKRPGSKFATHDLIGSPWQIIIGSKKAAQNLVELKNRKTGEMQDMDWQIAVNEVIDNLNVR